MPQLEPIAGTMIKIDHGETEVAPLPNILVGQNRNFDLKKFDDLCEKIVQKHSANFIELGLIDDEKNSDTDGKLKKQEQLKANFAKDKPEVRSEVLSMPTGKDEN